MISRHVDGTLDKAVYQKEVHTDVYLNNWSHHHPVEKHGLLMILMECEHRIADQVHLLEEGKHLLKNGYSRIETQWEFAALENELKGHQRSSNGAILSDHDK